MTIPHELIARLEALEAKATKGPWYKPEVGAKYPDGGMNAGCHYEEGDLWACEVWAKELESEEIPQIANEVYSVDDALLIAESRNALPLLLAELRRLQKIEGDYRAYFEGQRRAKVDRDFAEGKP